MVVTEVVLVVLVAKVVLVELVVLVVEELVVLAIVKEEVLVEFVVLVVVKLVFVTDVVEDVVVPDEVEADIFAVEAVVEVEGSTVVLDPLIKKIITAEEHHAVYKYIYK